MNQLDATQEIESLEITAADPLSIVVPLYNEAGNIIPLVKEICQALEDYHGQWELICVNDGSRDNSEQELIQAREQFGEHIYPLTFTRNFGQTAAMQAGIEASRGDVIVTLDGDRQNDPADIPRMVQYLKEKDLDMVTGWRKHRQDSPITRKLPSLIANHLIRRVTGVIVQDYGCSLKAFRAPIIKQINLIGEMHRFIPAWVASITDPHRIGEIAVNHRARDIGESKYGISRTIRVILDLFAVVFFMRFSRRPGHFFGSLGLGSSAIGSIILVYLLGVKIFLGEDIGGRPLLFTGILLVITGIQLISTGVLAEMQTRAAPSSQYPTRNSNHTRAWHPPKNNS